MADKATLKREGKEYEFPLIAGTGNETAIDVKALRAATNGVITIDPGYKNTGSCKSEITFLNGEEGILRYRGYSIEELADKAGFLEVAYLLIFGDLPTTEQLDKFHADIKANSIVDEDVKKNHRCISKKCTPYGNFIFCNKCFGCF
jgi:citrate synthase